MDSLLFQSAGRCAAMIRAKKLSPVELVNAVLARIDQINPLLHVFVSVNHDGAIGEARAAEAAVMRGGALGPLHGVPYSVKDNVDVRGLASTLGLKLMRNNVAGA